MIQVGIERACMGVNGPATGVELEASHGFSRYEDRIVDPVRESLSITIGLNRYWEQGRGKVTGSVMWLLRIWQRR